MKHWFGSCWNGCAGAVLALAMILWGTGCMSYTVKGGRPIGTPGNTLEQRFTVTQLESAVSLDYGPGAFAAATGMDDLNAKRDELSAILCRERPDLFVDSGGIPFGVVATMGGLQDWPGNRFGTLALYVVTLGCWPASLEEHVPGVAYLYAPRQPERALAKKQLMCGYKCNVSVFTPLGLFPGLNGISGCDGLETTGTVSPSPDSGQTVPVFLTEIARAVADAMTSKVRERIATPAEGQAVDDSAGGAVLPADAKEGYVDIIGGPTDMGREIFFFVNGDESRPAPIMVGGQRRAPFPPGNHLFATRKIEQSVTFTVTAKSVVKTPGMARFIWQKTPVHVEAGKVTLINVSGSGLEVRAPMSRNDAEMFKIRLWSRAPKAGASSRPVH